MSDKDLVLENLKLKTGKTFFPWLEKINFIDKQNGNMIIECSSSFTKEQVKKNIDIIRQAFFNDGRSYNFSYVIDEKAATNEASKQGENSTYKNKNQKNEAKTPRGFSPINKDFTFANFVCGDNTTYAMALAQAIAQNPGQSYNPCLFYGSVGLGKTHLAQAIANYIKANNKNMKCIYVSCDKFTTDFMKGIQTNNLEPFKDLYSSCDLLIIDDIQFLEGKEQTQLALFNIFNLLKDSGKQMVFTSDRPISALNRIMERLTSRLMNGTCADLKPPSYETRLVIIKKKIEMQNGYLNDDVIQYIAKNVSSNVRDIESCVKRLCSFSKLINHNVTLEMAQEHLRDFVVNSQDTSKVTMDLIIKNVADEFNIPMVDLKSKKRTKAISQPRFIVFYLGTTLTNLTTTEIGLSVGGRDHTTVMYGAKEIENALKVDVDKKLLNIINNIKEKIIRSSRSNQSPH